jgi:hypothetical protein
VPHKESEFDLNARFVNYLRIPTDERRPDAQDRSTKAQLIDSRLVNHVRKGCESAGGRTDNSRNWHKKCHNGEQAWP